METYHHISISQFLKLLEISRSLLQHHFFNILRLFVFLQNSFSTREWSEIISNKHDISLFPCNSPSDLGLTILVHIKTRPEASLSRNGSQNVWD